VRLREAQHHADPTLVQLASGLPRARHCRRCRRYRRLGGRLTLTGKNSCFFRPPGGFATPGMGAEAAKNRMSTVMWSVDTNDWKQPSRTTTTSTKAIISAAQQSYSQTHPIILMHVGKASHEPESQVTSNRSNDVAALPAIIQGYLSRGYRFVDMSGRSGLNARTTSVSLSSGSVNVPVNQASTAVTATVKDVRGPGGPKKAGGGRRRRGLAFRPAGTNETPRRGRNAWSGQRRAAARISWGSAKARPSSMSVRSAKCALPGLRPSTWLLLRVSRFRCRLHRGCAAI
jgi:hypothetical protein